MSFEEGNPTLRHRTSIGVYGSYLEAQEAVDLLSDEGFPVERVAIVGTGLRYVEQVAGRLTTGRAALVGAGQGLLLGVLFALLLGLFFPYRGAFLGLLIYGLVLGALFGALFGAVGHGATGGRRDFSSVPTMSADRYEVMVDAEVADRGRQLLTEKLPARRETGRATEAESERR